MRMYFLDKDDVMTIFDDVTKVNKRKNTLYIHRNHGMAECDDVIKLENIVRYGELK